MRIIFLAYRNWAIEVYDSIKSNKKVKYSVLCKTNDCLSKLKLKDFDLLISCGWSDELGPKVVDQITAIGVHCAELDRYSYGSPIQLQILDGLTKTKHRVFSFTHDENSKRAHTHNRLYSHEVDLDLTGNMSDILKEMTVTSKELFKNFINDYPQISWREWPEERIIRKKRVPSDSKLSKEDFLKMDSESLYNFFRCLEDPYPNGYIEDEKGKLFIERVRYLKKKK